MDGDDFYKPAGGTAVADSPAPAASAGSADRPPNRGSFSWTASEYIDHQKGSGWYMLLLLTTAVLAGVIYLLTKEYFAAGTIVVVGLIVGFYARQKPRQIKYELDDSGLRIGDKFYGYDLFKSFSLIKDGTLNSVHLTPLKRFMPPISAFYEAGDEEKITDILGERLPFEDTKPSGIDRLSRRLKL